MINDDDALVNAAADVARSAEAGRSVPDSITSMLRAIASTRDEARRHELAREAAAQAGQLGDVALTLLRAAIFAVV